ncbi:dienelactone hydrolase family protein [Muriicola sp. Z0-33]|uniref:dienelactone hydrolase family protein n=1 Tax=Muriicola sp. Z0-33 TaxID=2816957 RepID=UPI0022370BE3|nr:alpha/beta family hydrolase [Muriicola sp. Z0-33]MCW5517141.1 dienelactone hydrolase family protein [Muriicola sp. Z0-33]
MIVQDELRKNVSIKVDGAILKGHLAIPKNPAGLVIFSHGSGSSRLSPRNNYVAEVLQKKGMATLLFDLLTEDEDRNYDKRFDINLLTTRLIAVTLWVQQQEDTEKLAVGYFGASTGAASALRAAAFYGKDIKAVVSRGGRPDLAYDELYKVIAPTLLIVGGRDDVVIELNETAYRKLSATRKLEIIPGATHLFAEPGKLQEVAQISADWFSNHFLNKKIETNV